MNPSKLQPALLGGVAIGVLTALPVVNIVNLCCCAWVIFGGALAAYVMQQNHPAPVSAGDGAVVGLMAGAIGAVVGSLLSIPIAMALGPMQSQILERVLEGARDLPPEAQSILEQMRGGMMGGAVVGAAMLIGIGVQRLRLLGIRAGRWPDWRVHVQEEHAATAAAADPGIPAADVHAAVVVPAAAPPAAAPPTA